MKDEPDLALRRSRGRRTLLKVLAAVGGGGAASVLRVKHWESPKVEVGLLPVSAGLSSNFNSNLNGQYLLQQTGTLDDYGFIHILDPNADLIDGNTMQVVSTSVNQFSGDVKVTIPRHQNPYTGEYSNNDSQGNFTAMTQVWQHDSLGLLRGIIYCSLTGSGFLSGNLTIEEVFGEDPDADVGYSSTWNFDGTKV